MRKILHTIYVAEHTNAHISTHQLFCACAVG